MDGWIKKTPTGEVDITVTFKNVPRYKLLKIARLMDGDKDLESLSAELQIPMFALLHYEQGAKLSEKTVERINDYTKRILKGRVSEIIAHTKVLEDGETYE